MCRTLIMGIALSMRVIEKADRNATIDESEYQSLQVLGFAGFFRRPIGICKFRRPYFFHGWILATIPDYRAVRFILYLVGSIMVHPYELSEYLTMPMDFGFSLGKLLYVFDMPTAHR